MFILKVNKLLIRYKGKDAVKGKDHYHVQCPSFLDAVKGKDHYHVLKSTMN